MAGRPIPPCKGGAQTLAVDAKKMTIVPLEPKAGTEHLADCTYGTARRDGQSVALAADLFLPPKASRPAPLLVWLGADILSLKRPGHAGHRILASRLTRLGVAMAAPRVRVGAGRADLRKHVLERLPEIERQRDITVPPALSSFAALAAVEDICTFLTWVGEAGARHHLSGRVVLAGSSIGGAMAFHTGFVAPSLWLERPNPAGIMSFSGSSAWPGLYMPGRYKVFALHSPTDQRIRIDQVRAMAQTDPAFELIECVEQAHGSLGIWPGEALEEASQRIVAKVNRWCK